MGRQALSADQGTCTADGRDKTETIRRFDVEQIKSDT